ncbi:Phage integrase, N-terminal SAM-like domain [Ruminococcus sp. YE71]|uniref:N-terminal phage integrase SAM-like domain-containing protein n=1 Tax=unclassified Ruminococcus TaxID=2608920 RepID=UPI00088982E0|nr:MULTISPECIES: N-terminal phage integrase SAM-like domain-containing protein [unclassified Ruminococcus]SDA20021.1 Phage integrase, N-terminal SAM-like domain [Ruminococcus sp. YE78]SFW31714.1 Phage integrase, N-terminal SAM-like domain [Ruminococcus sp. YE71]
MAYIEKRKNKKGEVTAYRIRVYSGYDVHGKQMVQFKTWVPPEGMTANQIKKELQRQAVLFEEECANGQVTANIKFQKFAEQWFEEYAEFNHRSTTLEREKKITDRVYPALGHLRIDKISARDIQKFINSLAKPGANMRNGKPVLSLINRLAQSSQTFFAIFMVYISRLRSFFPSKTLTLWNGS